ncbi:hypothetical protein BOW50_07650 [Solemya velum gill symbiont]|uniref:ExbD/TolR family protein n=1 Tax=Solemya velum gill symbiont TaxID=2340 RepID=UPI0009963CDE|nr:biopolymer transporter ExbD [Solemya velum gill symbiont]OOZ77730.1 hypothetical protein BOW50_07650 [Solemya velum gill symbiont]
MAYERPRHSNVVLNLTPLIDIVFLLLVFFMLTAHFIEDQALVVDLPDANSAPAAAEHKEIVTVILSPEGVKTENRIVRIRGDNEASLGSAVKVLDAAEASGAKAVDILTEKP